MRLCIARLILEHAETHSFTLFFFKDTATTEIYTLSLHDALPISRKPTGSASRTPHWPHCRRTNCRRASTNIGWKSAEDRKSTRLNSSHVEISYAVFCLEKKKEAIDEGRAEAPSLE